MVAVSFNLHVDVWYICWSHNTHELQVYVVRFVHDLFYTKATVDKKMNERSSLIQWLKYIAKSLYKTLIILMYPGNEKLP